MTFNEWAVQEYAMLLAQRDEYRHDLSRVIQWWWNTRSRDFLDYSENDDMWFDLADKYNINLSSPVSAVEQMHRRWAVPYEDAPATHEDAPGSTEIQKEG